MSAERKLCTRCQTVKAPADFNKRARAYDGLRPECRACQCATTDDWRSRNTERKRESNRAWKRRNPGLSAAYESQRRARVAGGGRHPYDRAEILARWSGCTYCDSPAEALDHVTPISAGGADAEWNLVPACTPCNSSKGAKSLADWATTF